MSKMEYVVQIACIDRDLVQNIHIKRAVMGGQRTKRLSQTTRKKEKTILLLHTR